MTKCACVVCVRSVAQSEDFDIRYAALAPSARLLASLKAYHPGGADEARALAELITHLEQHEPVELFLGH